MAPTNLQPCAVGGAGSGRLPKDGGCLTGSTQFADVLAVRFPNGTVLGSFRIKHSSPADGVVGESAGIVEDLRVEHNVAHVMGRIVHGSMNGVGDLSGTEASLTITAGRDDSFAIRLHALSDACEPATVRVTRGNFILVGTE